MSKICNYYAVNIFAVNYSFRPKEKHKNRNFLNLNFNYSIVSYLHYFFSNNKKNYYFYFKKSSFSSSLQKKENTIFSEPFVFSSFFQKSFFTQSRNMSKAMEKNLSMAKMSESYNPREVEIGWMDFWEAEELFKGDSNLAKNATSSKKFIMVIPPPNVTGNLHIGHALTIAIQDALTRWHRMRGDVTLWIPGIDHAGIATQSVVENVLYKTDKITRHDLGRDDFIQRVWTWKKTYGNNIFMQLRRLGASVDSSRSCFTMDPKLSEAVNEAFVRLYELNLIYRDIRLVSWSPHLKTAISDIEVESLLVDKPAKINVPGFPHTVQIGVLWHFSYEVADDLPVHDKIEVATTRIETMLGDTAIAVNPNDIRYKHLVGKRVIHPFAKDRQMYIIADEYVDMSFATGAVKITPAHDKNDFEVGKRHNLEFINIFTLDGHINENGGSFVGQHRFECRHNIIIELEKLGLLGETKPNPNMSLPLCSRSGDIIEYMMRPQWWMSCGDMAKRAIDAVKQGDLKLVPSYYNQTWYHWLENISDWCISRQLWWGHRIPAYKIVLEDCDERNGKEEKEEKEEKERKEEKEEKEEMWVAGRTEEEAREKAKNLLKQKNIQITKFDLQQDEDVLDTWFSSGLFPFSVFGWPKETEDFNSFYPNTFLETGHDILFFWVARMIMLGLQLTNRLPFKEVYLHAMVRDAHGQKMSKSKGNVIDPLEVIEGISLESLQNKIKQSNLPQKEIKRALDAQSKNFKEGIQECGADALRYGLLAYTKQGANINMDINRIVGYRHFCNKLWNVVKFALSKFEMHDFWKNVLIEENMKDCENLDSNLKLDFGNVNIYCGRLYSNSLRNMKQDFSLSTDHLKFEDKWILHKINLCTKLTNEALSTFQFSSAVMHTYNFWLYELCDVYLEIIKSRLTKSMSNNEKDCVNEENREKERINVACSDAFTCCKILYLCLDRGLKLLHPFTPFITEELYQRLRYNFYSDDCSDHTLKNKSYKSISVEPYPEYVFLWNSPSIDEEMNLVLKVVHQFRALCTSLNISFKDNPKALVICDVANHNNESNSEELYKSEEFNDLKTFKLISNNSAQIAALAKLLSVDVYMKSEISESTLSAYVEDVVNSKINIYLNVKDMLNVAQKVDKMKTKLDKQQKLMEHYKEKLNKGKTKAPEDVQIETKRRIEDLEKEIISIERAMKNLCSIK